jgi:hypothetical protein
MKPPFDDTDRTTICDRCGGDGFEPKHNTEEDEDHEDI